MQRFDPHTVITIYTYDMASVGFDYSDILKRCPNTKKKDGVYNIINGSNKIKAVYCDMTTDNGGWTVRYASPSLLFSRMSYISLHFMNHLYR